MLIKKFTRFAGLAAAVAVVLVVSLGAQQARVAGQTAEYATTVALLLPTNHPVLPRELSQLWLVPSGSRPSAQELATASRLQARGEYTKSLAIFTRASTQNDLVGLYATYDMAVSLLNLSRAAEARKAFRSVVDRHPIGNLAEAAAFGEAQSAETMKDYAGAFPIYEQLARSKVGRMEEVLFRLGVTAKALGDFNRAASAFMQVYYNFPLSESAPFAGAQLATLPTAPVVAAGSDRYKLELARAERLFAVKQYTPARTAFTALKLFARGDDKELVDLRIAEANVLLRRTRDGRDGLRPYLSGATRQAEALYYQALALRDLNLIPDYVTASHRVVDDYPAETWAQESLNTLATYYIVHDEDDKADEVLRELYGTFPKGLYAERAAWRVGWRAFLQQRYDETTMYFERAAADFPRSDYRPMYLYWSGRAHELADDRKVASDRFSLVTADYLNSYYGRLAVKRLGGAAPAARVNADVSQPPTTASPTPEQTVVIRALLSAGLHTDATNELRYAQRTTGDSAAIQATLAWSSYQQGLLETGQDRFTLLRGAITTMRRAYPQFMAAGGEQLPREILSLIFPVEYWDLIQKYSALNGLDPYLVAALVAQESTFTADVRSPANAYGLMQLLPSTARQQARKLNMTYSSRLLTTAEPNIRMGTLYFAEKIKEFGGIHTALASYNAGEAAVHRWIEERPSLDVETFIDDIPYPETQNYVKRILGTAEDYRRLYSK